MASANESAARSYGSYGRPNRSANYRRADYQRGSAVPVARPRQPAAEPRRAPRPRVVRKTKAQLRAEARRSRAVAIRILTVATVLFTMIAFQIYSQVRVDELDHQLNDINRQISIVESDNARLNMMLDASISLDKVDDYARNKLGMVKVSDYQVNYVKLSEADSVEVSGGKIHQSLWERIKSVL